MGVFFGMLSSGVAGIIASAAMIGRDLSLARQFGIGSSVDSYIVSYTFLIFLGAVFANSISPALMPAYIRASARGDEEAAYRLARRAIVIAAVGMSCLAVLVATQIDMILRLVGSNLSSEGRAIGGETMGWMVGILPIQGVAAVLAVISNAKGKFARPGLAPALPPIGATAALLLYAHRFGITAVAAGTLIGSVAQLIVFIPEWKCALRVGNARIDSGTWKEIVRQYWPVLAGTVLLSATPIIDQSMAGSLAEGSVSALSYGQKLASLILNIGALVLGNAILPHLSEMVAKGEWAELRHSIRTIRSLVVAVSVPVTIMLFLYSGPIAGLIYKRGALSASQAAEIGHIQAMLLLQLPFYFIGILSVRLISALNANIILMYGTIFSVGLKVALNLGLMRWLGVAGIGLSTSLVYACSCAYLTVAASRLLGRRARSLSSYAIGNS